MVHSPSSRRSVALALALGAAPLAHAEPDGPTHDIVPEDAFTLDAAYGLTVNRAGTRAVYVRSRWDEDADGRHAELWTLDTRGRGNERLTFTEDGAGSPTFSPDDAWVYFTSKGEDGKRQVFRVAPEGGTPQQVTRVEGGISDYALSADGDDLYLLSRDDTDADDAWAPLRSRFSDLEYVRRARTTATIHRLDLETWRQEPVWEVDRHVLEWAVSPDERKIAAITAPDAALVTHEGWSEITVYDVAAGTATDLEDGLWRDDAPSPYGWLLGLAWSDDSRALAHRVDFDGYPGETFVTEFAGDEPETWVIPRPREVTASGGQVRWVPGTRELCFLGTEQARARLICHDKVQAGTVGRERTLPEGNVVVSDYAFSGDGRDLLLVAGTPERFPEIYRLPARGRLLPVQLTTLNPHTADWRLPELRLVSWTAPDGATVEGILETPPGWTEADGPLPLLVSIHGGPTSYTPYMRRFRIYGQTSFAAKGWAMLSPNYRGSTGYGDAFLVQLVGRENDIEVNDILAGVDHLVAEGIADPDRLAVQGWSNGGYLTNALIATTDRFKAASSGAGVFDQTIQWALEDTPGHVINYMEGMPWEKAEHYREGSPLFHADRIVTPTIIHVGEFDERVPAAHARTLFRALDVYLDVPSELIVYPGAGHGLGKLSQRKAKLLWDHAWFAHWVLGEDAPGSGAPDLPRMLVPTDQAADRRHARTQLGEAVPAQPLPSTDDE